MPITTQTNKLKVKNGNSYVSLDAINDATTAIKIQLNLLP